MTKYNTINAKADTYEMLNEDKPDGVTWDRFLRQMHDCYSKCGLERGDD